MIGDSSSANTSMVAADFLYQAAAAKLYHVRAESGELGNALPTLAFDVKIKGPDQAEQIAYRRFVLPLEPEDEAEKAPWLARLRRFALDVVVNELDADALAQEEFRVQKDQVGDGSRFEFRACDLQVERPNGDLVCTACIKGDHRATRAICEKCGMPDPWERCRHITHVQTWPIGADSISLLRRQCDGLCQIGAGPSAQVPQPCRAGGHQPKCFAPPMIKAPVAVETSGGALPGLDTVLNRLNTAWKRVFDYPLFVFASFEPLQALRMGVATAQDYHMGVLRLAEIIDSVNQEGLGKRLEGALARREGTISALQAFMAKRPWPNQEMAIKLLRDTHSLRNLPPTHPVEWEAAEKAMAVARQMGFPYPVARADWPNLWRATLSGFERALELLLTDLEAYHP